MVNSGNSEFFKIDFENKSEGSTITNLLVGESPEIDPASWKMETERLVGVLSQKAMSYAHADVGWQSHLSALLGSFTKLFPSKNSNEDALGVAIISAMADTQRTLADHTTVILRKERLLQTREDLMKAAKDYFLLYNVKFIHMLLKIIYFFQDLKEYGRRIEVLNSKISSKSEVLREIEEKIEENAELKESGLRDHSAENSSAFFNNALKVLRVELHEIDKRIALTNSLLLTKRIEDRILRGIERKLNTSRQKNRSLDHAHGIGISQEY